MRRIHFSEGENYMLSRPEKVQSTPNCALLESATLLPEGCCLSFPAVWNPTLLEGRGMANLGRNRLKAREQIAAETGISVLVGGSE